MIDITSPDSFIDFGFYSLIAASLQRKVWRGDIRNPLFPNLYVGMVAPASCGKGRVITEVEKLLRSLKLKDSLEKDIMHNESTEDEGELPKETKRSRLKESPLLIPIGADAITYEKLMLTMSKSTRAHWYQNGDTKKSLYFHSSIFICLDEMSSMFRKHTEDLVNFFLKTYDCKDYRYETISRGTDFIRNCCLNLLFGTTPEFMKTIFDQELVAQGFSSRVCFISEQFPRSYRLAPPVYSDKQLQNHADITNHIKTLASLFGEVKFTDEASEFLEYWWRTDAQDKRANNSPKLIPYYGRKNILIQKMSMVIHFMESTTMEVNLEECKKALEVLEKAEVKMHHAVMLDNRNPLMKVTEDIIVFLKQNGPTNKSELLIEFHSALPEGLKSFDEIVKYLHATNKIKIVEGNKYGII